jgi:transposase
MGKPYSEDLRARVVRAAQDGTTIPETAEQLRVSISSVVRFRRLHRETSSVSPAKFGGYKGYALAAHEELVRELVAEQPDITLAEIKAVLATEKVTVGRSSISRFLHHLKLRFKKSLRAAEQDRPDVAAARPSRSCSRGSIRSGLSLSMKPASPRRSPACTGGHRRANGLCKRCCTATGRPSLSSLHYAMIASPRPSCSKDR